MSYAIHLSARSLFGWSPAVSRLHSWLVLLLEYNPWFVLCYPLILHLDSHFHHFQRNPAWLLMKEGYAYAMPFIGMQVESWITLSIAMQVLRIPFLRFLQPTFQAHQHVHVNIEPMLMFLQILLLWKFQTKHHASSLRSRTVFKMNRDSWLDAGRWWIVLKATALNKFHPRYSHWIWIQRKTYAAACIHFFIQRYFQQRVWTSIAKVTFFENTNRSVRLVL